MGLSNRTLKGLIEYSDLRNEAGLYNETDVTGVSTSKEMISTKANLDGVNLLSYKLFPPKSFAYVADTSRRGDKIALTYNNTNKTYIVSTWYVVFHLSDKAKSILLPEYLFLFFNRSEFDRYARTNSWGSAREYFWFEDMEDVIVTLPSIEIQRKYVDVYLSLLNNLTIYQSKVDELKLVCDSYIEELRRNYLCEAINSYISLRTEQNFDLKYSNSEVLGVSQDKKIIPTKSDTRSNDISKFTVIHPNDFVYNPRNGIAVGLNKQNAIISWNNTAFYIKSEKLLPEYLMMWLSRSEWDRKVKFDSWGSSTEVYSFDALGNTKIPIPSIEIQKSIASIYQVYQDRIVIATKLKEHLNNLCPILLKGSLEASC